MWVNKTPSGKYQYVERYDDPATGKKKYVSVVLDGNRRGDRRTASEALRNRVERIYIEAGKSSKLTVKQLERLYTQSQRHVLKPQSAKTCERRAKTVTELLGKDTMVSDLTAQMLKEKLNDESPTRFNQRLMHVKALLRWAYQEDIMADISFIDKVKRRKDTPVRAKVQGKFLERDELRALLSGMTNTQWRLLTEFLALSGLRIGEAIALTPGDVDQDNRVIRVSKTFSIVLREVTETPKTETSVRDVYIQDELAECIERINAYYSKLDHTWFFGGDERIAYESYLCYLGKYTKKIIGRRLTPHALRHTHVALLAEAGMGLDAISRRLGHADSSITKEVYFHVTERLRNAENEQLKSIRFM